MRIHLADVAPFRYDALSPDVRFRSQWLVASMHDLVLELHETPVAFEHMGRGDHYARWHLIFNEKQEVCEGAPYNPCAEFKGDEFKQQSAWMQRAIRNNRRAALSHAAKLKHLRTIKRRLKDDVTNTQKYCWMQHDHKGRQCFKMDLLKELLLREDVFFRKHELKRKCNRKHTAEMEEDVITYEYPRGAGNECLV